MQHHDKDINTQETNSKRQIKFAVIAFAIIELVVMIAILYYQRTR